MVLGLIGLFFLCRGRRSRLSKPIAIIGVGADSYNTPADDTFASHPRGVFTVPRLEPDRANIIPNSDGQGTNFLPVPTLFTDMHVVEPSPRHEDHCISATNTTQSNIPSQDLSDQSQENSLISLISNIVREIDTDRFVQKQLPPAYDENWQSTIPYQLSSSH